MSRVETALAESNGQAAKLAFLCRAASYPDRPRAVEVLETHMSWVFLTDRHAYKMKKPVRTDYLDFSTRDRRRHYCEEEMRLNRRLAPEVYLAAVPLTAAPSGELQLGGSGTPLDWLVKMRRLPAERMLDRAIADWRVTDGEIEAVAELLVAFYRTAPRIDLAPEAYRARYRAAIEDNRNELTVHGAAIPRARIDAVARTQSAFLAENAELFDRRIAAKAIVEGHGDLRPEHVFLGPPPQIIDCLEFERGFRILDAGDDLATLAMDCDRLGDERVGRTLYATYNQEVRDPVPEQLIAFYKAFRAVLRAKLAIWHLKDEAISDHGFWEQRAQDYLDLAARLL